MKIAFAPAKFLLIILLLASTTACKKQPSPIRSSGNAKENVAKDTPTQSLDAKPTSTVAAASFDTDRIRREYSDRGYRLQYVDNDPTQDFVMATPRNCAVVFKSSNGQVSSIEIYTMAFDVNANNQEEAFEKIKLSHDEVCDAAVLIYPTASGEIRRWYASCLERGLPKAKSSESKYFGPFLYSFESNELNVTVTVWPPH